MLQSRSVISHAVFSPGKVEASVAVPMQALVRAGEVAQLGGGPFGGDSTLCESRDRRGVVRAVGQRRVADVIMVGHDVQLSEQAGLLEVTVGDAARRVLLRHEFGLD